MNINDDSLGDVPISHDYEDAEHPLLRVDKVEDKCSNHKSLWDRHKYFVILTSCNLVQALGMILLMPMLIPLKSEFFGTPSDAARISSRIDAASATISFFIGGSLGLLSDSIGRRPLIVAGSILSFIPAFNLWWNSENLWFYIIARAVVSAVSPGSVSGATIAYLSDVYEKEQLAKYFGLLFGVFCVPMVLSPFVQHYLRPPLHVCILIYVITSGVAALATLLFLPESLPKERRTQFVFSKVSNPFVPLLFLFQNPLMMVLTLIVFFSSMPEAGLMEIVMYYLTKKLDFTPELQSWYFAEIGLCSIFVQVILLGILVKLKVREAIILILALFMNALHMSAYALSSKCWMIFAFAAPLASGSFLQQPAISAMISKSVSKEQQGLAQGTMAPVKGLVSIIGPLTFGAIFGSKSGFGHDHPELSFHIAAVSVYVSIVIAICALPILGRNYPTTVLSAISITDIDSQEGA